jgi:hypothetical protein
MVVTSPLVGFRWQPWEHSVLRARAYVIRSASRHHVPDALIEITQRKFDYIGIIYTGIYTQCLYVSYENAHKTVQNETERCHIRQIISGNFLLYI